MKKFLLLLLVIPLLAIPSCHPSDPTFEPIYIGDTINLVDDGLVYLEFRPDTDFETVRAQGKPTWVHRGVTGGFSLPVYAVDNEELYLEICVPNRYDESSDIVLHLECYVDTAQDAANDAFNLQIEWEDYTPGIDIVPNTTHTISVETTTGVCAQFQSFRPELTVDYDIHAGNLIEGDDMLAFRLRRIAVVAGNEADGEIVINHMGVNFRCDKIGNITP